MTTLTLIACTDDGSSSSPPPNEAPTEIQGTIIDETSGEPIRGVSVRTDPPSEEVLTDINGHYSIELDSSVTDPIRVVVSHDAYVYRQTEVTPQMGNSIEVSFSLQNSEIGLYASSTIVLFVDGADRETLRLTSNVQNTGYSIIPADPWISVYPSSGVIANRETAVLQITVNQNLVPPLPASSELVINSDNGTRELVITLIFQESVNNPDQGQGSLLHDRQNDCRQNDVLRFGYNNPNWPVVQFPESLVLPSDTNLRRYTIDNPFLIDSVVVTELGVITIKHLAGGLANTSLEMFEINKQDEIESVAVNTGVSETNRRAAIEWALIPGVYCYYLGGTEENFSGTVVLDVSIDFIPAQ